MHERSVHGDGASLRIDIDPQVSKTQAFDREITRSVRNRQKGCDLDKDGSHLCNQLSTLLSTQ